jgi:hypothetical protein
MYYRKQADDQVYCLVDSVAERTKEAQPGFGIEINPQSRMYDPNSPDFPPMPPDDPEAHSYMHCVDCKRGYPCWHCNGDTPYVANPYWLQYLPRNDKGELLLDMRGAVDVALVNSTDYQSQLETLYLSALDVTFERFRFDSQFYGGSSIFYTTDGALRGGGNSSSLLNVSPLDPTNRLRVQRMFAGGGELVVGFANSLVWEFSGPNTQSVNSLLDFSFIQPLLRAGGRALVLERLTIAERTLLENVRQMERFRRGFYAEIATGRDAGQGPSRRGGFFGGSGLEGFSGVGGGGFGRVGNSGGIGSTNTGAGAAGAGGYMGLLQSLQEIRNLQANVNALRVSLAQLRAFADAGRLGNRAEVQLGQAASALYNAESRLLTSKAQYQSDLDSYKIVIGLPPNLPLKIEDGALDQFNFIDPQLVKIQRTVEQLLDETRKIEFARLEREDEAAEAAEAGAAAAGAAVAEVPAAQPGAGPELRPAGPKPKPAGPELVSALPSEVEIESLLETAEIVRKDVDTHLLMVEADMLKLDEISETRRRDLKRLAAREEVQRKDVDENLLDATRFDARVAALKEDYKSLQQRFDCDWKTLQALRQASAEGKDLSRLSFPCRERELPLLDPDAPVEDAPEPGDELQPRVIPDPFKEEQVARDRTPWTTVLTELSRDLLELSLVQARIRCNTVVLLPIELNSEQAIRIASKNRRDWANARAELVNAWRLIQFNANALKSGLDLTFSGDVGNVGKNPLDLDARTGRLRVGLKFDAPLTRLSERNIYRQSLIEYQQARRSYYKLVDQIHRSLRLSLRTIQLNDLNFELRREAVQVALRRYHFTLLDLDRPASRTAPAGPGQLAEGGEDFGATTARDMVDALSDLQNAQNDFLSVWVNYEVQRLSLDFDLGTMQIDGNGLWIDPGQDVGRENAPVLRPGGHGDYNASEIAGNDWRGFFDPACGPTGQCDEATGCTDLELLQLPEIVVPEEAGAGEAASAEKSTGEGKSASVEKMSHEEAAEPDEVASDPYETTAAEAAESARQMAVVRTARARLNGSERAGWQHRIERPAARSNTDARSSGGDRPAVRPISRDRAGQARPGAGRFSEVGDMRDPYSPSVVERSQQFLVSSRKWFVSHSNSLVQSLQSQPAERQQAFEYEYNRARTQSAFEPKVIEQTAFIPAAESNFAERAVAYQRDQPAQPRSRTSGPRDLRRIHPAGQASDQRSPANEYPRRSVPRNSQSYPARRAMASQPMNQIFPAPGADSPHGKRVIEAADEAEDATGGITADENDATSQNPASPAGLNTEGDGWRPARRSSR